MYQKVCADREKITMRENVCRNWKVYVLYMHVPPLESVSRSRWILSQMNVTTRRYVVCDMM